jgi:glucose-6-phosphate 1-dehydrogenase
MKTKLVIFGITGDLSKRKLLPAIEHIFDAGEIANLEIIGVSRRNVHVSDLLQQSVGRTDMTKKLSMFTMDVADPDDYQRLRDYIDLDQNDQLLIYLSVPPSAAVHIVDFLGQAGLNTPNVKLLLEKPFGFDYESASGYIDRTTRYFLEDQIYRIDHYMAKDMALLLRKEHASKQWSNQTVEAIEVTATETIGIEGRAMLYEEIGALRDFLQGHLLQLLSLVLAKSVDMTLPECRLAALDQLQPIDPAHGHRAQYEGYQEEVNNPGSLVETFTLAAISSNDPRWQGVTISLMTGKALDKKRSYIRIRYKDGTETVYEEGLVSLEDSQRKLDAYERVLLEAINGRKEIFTTGAEVLRSWQLVAPLQRQWASDNTPLYQYARGIEAQEIIDTLTHRSAV